MSGAPGTPPPGYFEKEEKANLYYQAKINGNISVGRSALSDKNNFNTQSFYSTSKRLSMLQKPQDTGYWCGFASLESIIDYEGMDKTQTDICYDIYGTESSTQTLGWYENNSDTLDQYKGVSYLRDQTSFAYAPFPWAPVGTVAITADEVTTRIVSTIDGEHGCMALGESTTNNKLHPNYPNAKIGHWIAIDGYLNSGDDIYIIDSANSDAISWSVKPPSYYSITNSKLASFAASRGIFW